MIPQSQEISNLEFSNWAHRMMIYRNNLNQELRSVTLTEFK